MSIEISSEDNDSSCEGLPEISMPSTSGKTRNRSDSGTFDPAVMDTDAMFDDMFQNKKKSLQNIQRPDSGYFGVTADSKDDGVRGTSTASLMHVDSGISLRSVMSTDSENPVTSSSETKGKRKAVGRPDKVTKTAEKESKKQKIAEERAAKQAANELNKVYKPGECMKYMNIEARPSLLSAWYLADLQREASAASVRIVPSPDLVHEGLVMWSRRKPQTFSSENGLARLSEPTERCSHALLIMSAAEAAPLVLDHTLAEHVAQVRWMAGCRLTLVVYGAKDYYTSTRQKKQTDKRKFNELDLEMSFTDLLVSANCDAVSINKPIDLALLIVQFTKALAEAPHKLAKRQCDEQAEFYMRGDNKNCVAVDKDGHGLSRLWQQMLAVLPLSSLDAARSVCTQYASPLDLFEAMQDPSNLSTLANIGVDRAGLPNARARKLGPEFSRRLKVLMTADDGETMLD